MFKKAKGKENELILAKSETVEPLKKTSTAQHRSEIDFEDKLASKFQEEKKRKIC